MQQLFTNTFADHMQLYFKRSHMYSNIAQSKIDVLMEILHTWMPAYIRQILYTTCVVTLFTTIRIEIEMTGLP